MHGIPDKRHSFYSALDYKTRTQVCDMIFLTLIKVKNIVQYSIVKKINWDMESRHSVHVSIN